MRPWARCTPRRPSRGAPPPAWPTSGTRAAHAGALPWFAIGGIDATTVGDVVAAGARRIVVVRAIAEAADPEAAARALRAALDTEALVGTP